MKKRVAWIVVAAAVTGLIAWSMVQRTRSRRIETGGQGAVPVAIDTPRRGEISRTISYAGTLAPSSMVTITPKVAGRVEEILVREGEAVSKDQELIRMEDEAVSLQRDQAASALAAARAQYDKAERGVRPEELANAQASLALAEKDFATAQESQQRAEKLYKEGTIARTKFEEAETRYRSTETQLENARRSVQMMEKGAGSEEQRLAEANVKAAQAQYELSELQVGFTRIASPIGGRVAKVFIDEGNMASLATALLLVVNDDRMTVRIPLPEKLYGEFTSRKGDIRTLVTLAALSGMKPIAGRISSISPTIDPASRTFTAEVEISNRSNLLRAGMYANVEFIMERIPDALLVPVLAVVIRNQRTGVFALEEETPDAASARKPIARFREIRAGLRDERNAQVLDGITESDLVVVEGNAFLEDGQQVSASRVTQGDQARNTSFVAAP